ncbi:hypothetical protein HHI36_021976 [Cryptolaemus montrouzieri]|uniref:Uncharacterized protein n=1 Tax=Cryptolaemus montrouzieri TaxID=559131 RepID=A0ABD2MYG2_9CUCU
MEEREVISKPMTLVKTTLKETEYKISAHGSMSKSFGVTRSLMQGDPLSTLLLNIAKEKCIREAKVTTSEAIYCSKSTEIIP